MRIAFLSWRDTGHPDGGGSEEYIEHVADRLAARGHDVTIRCAAYEGARRGEVRRGVRFVRRGGRLTVYPRGFLWATIGPGRRVDTVVEVVNGIPFGVGLVRRRSTLPLVHHLHREQWRMIYPGWRGRVGWLIERWTVRAYRALPFLTVSRATAADLEALGVVGPVHVVPNGAEPRPVQDVARSPWPVATPAYGCGSSARAGGSPSCGGTSRAAGPVTWWTWSGGWTPTSATGSWQRPRSCCSPRCARAGDWP